MKIPHTSKILSAATTLLTLLTLVPTTHAVSKPPFTDIYKDSLAYLYHHRFIDGYADGSFKPNNLINRAELVKMALYASNITPPTPSENCFPDVAKTEWYAAGICYAKSKNWIQGYPDGLFHPERNINRVETLKIIDKIQGWNKDGNCDYQNLKEEYKINIKDIDASQWYIPNVCSAYLRGFTDNVAYFKPAANYNREEVAELLFRTILEEKTTRLADLTYNENTNTYDFVSFLPERARDLFKVDEYYKNLTFDQATTANETTEPSGVQKLTTVDGDTYVLVEYRGILESSPTAGPSITLSYGVLHFDANKKLIGYATFFNTSDTRFSAEMKLTSVDGNKAITTFDCIESPVASSYSCTSEWFDKTYNVAIDTLR